MKILADQVSVNGWKGNVTEDYLHYSHQRKECSLTIGADQIVQQTADDYSNQMVDARTTTMEKQLLAMTSQERKCADVNDVDDDVDDGAGKKGDLRNATDYHPTHVFADMPRPTRRNPVARVRAH